MGIVTASNVGYFVTVIKADPMLVYRSDLLDWRQAERICVLSDLFVYTGPSDWWETYSKCVISQPLLMYYRPELLV